MSEYRSEYLAMKHSTWNQLFDRFMYIAQSSNGNYCFSSRCHSGNQERKIQSLKTATSLVTADDSGYIKKGIDNAECAVDAEKGNRIAIGYCRREISGG